MSPSRQIDPNPQNQTIARKTALTALRSEVITTTTSPRASTPSEGKVSMPEETGTRQKEAESGTDTSELSNRDPQGSPQINTTEINSKIALLSSLVTEISLDGLLQRKEELENALFILEKEHLNGLASDSSYYEIKARVIKELRKLDDKLAVIKAYSEKNKEFKELLPELDDVVGKLVSSAKKTEEPEKVESTLSDLTRKYLAGELTEDTYYDLKAKMAVKLASI